MSGNTTPTNNHSPPTSPFRIPSPYVHRRHRTLSTSERAAQEPELSVKIRTFCRQKGHGFLTPNDGGCDIFVHISDIEDQYVPVEGDEVTYRKVLVPPKCEKFQAVHVKITHLKEGTVHHRWDSPVPR